MKLNSVCKILVETKYRVRMEFLDGHFETITMDYLNASSDSFGKALATRNAWNKMNHRVQFIGINSCDGVLEIDIIEK